MHLKIVTDDSGTYLASVETGERIENAAVHVTACAQWPDTRSPLAVVSVVDAPTEIRARDAQVLTNVTGIVAATSR